VFAYRSAVVGLVKFLRIRRRVVCCALLDPGRDETNFHVAERFLAFWHPGLAVSGVIMLTSELFSGCPATTAAPSSSPPARSFANSVITNPHLAFAG